jgi:hypothetical protein
MSNRINTIQGEGFRAQNTVFNRQLSPDHLSVRLIRYWLGVEVFLTFIGVMLNFFLPKATGILCAMILCAILLTIILGFFLFFRYVSAEEVKKKRLYLSEKDKLVNKVSKLKIELSKVEQSLAAQRTHED